MRFNKIFALLAVAAILQGCASSGHRAPVSERGETGKKTADATQTKAPREKVAHEKDWRPRVHVVQKGDTLYSIAFNYGFDYHELADLNGIQNPSMISIGQQIRLFPGSSAPIAPPGAVEIKPIDSLVKEQPKVVKYTYSDAAMAQIDKVQEAKPETVAVAKAESKPKPEAKSDNTDDGVEEAALEWSMPTQGKLIAGFSESANRKGIDIAGKLGQPVTASARVLPPCTSGIAGGPSEMVNRTCPATTLRFDSLRLLYGIATAGMPVFSLSSSVAMVKAGDEVP